MFAWILTDKCIMVPGLQIVLAIVVLYGSSFLQRKGSAFCSALGMCDFVCNSRPEVTNNFQLIWSIHWGWKQEREDWLDPHMQGLATSWNTKGDTLLERRVRVIPDQQYQQRSQ